MIACEILYPKIGGKFCDKSNEPRLRAVKPAGQQVKRSLHFARTARALRDATYKRGLGVLSEFRAVRTYASYWF